MLTFSKTSAIEVSQRHATSSCTFKQVHASHWHKLWYSKVFARIKCLVWSPQVFANDWQHWHKLWHSKVFARVKRLVWSPHVFANDWQHWHKVWHSKVFARIKCMVWSPQVFANDWQHGPHPPKGVGGGGPRCFLRITHVNGASPWHWNKKRKLIIDSFKPLTCPQIGRADFFKDLRNRSQPATCNKQLHL